MLVSDSGGGFWTHPLSNQIERALFWFFSERVVRVWHFSYAVCSCAVFSLSSRFANECFFLSVPTILKAGNIHQKKQAVFLFVKEGTKLQEKHLLCESKR